MRDVQQPVEWHVERAKHYKALEQDSVFLYGLPPSGLPWGHVVAVEGGAGHRLGTSVSASFVAQHPCGLRFRWSLDYELKGANGSSSFSIDTQRIQYVLALLPPKMAALFATELAQVIEAVRERAAEYRAEADKQDNAANAITASLTAHHTTKAQSKRKANR